MWDANQDWQSESFKKMLTYERNNAREKLIYDTNQMINAYCDIKNNSDYICRNDDPQLLALIFSLISITYNKDDLSEYIRNENLFDFMDNFIQTNDEFSTLSIAHSMKMAEVNLDIGDKFIIPINEFKVYLPIDKYSGKYESNIDDWEFHYDNNILKIENGEITSLKKGCTIIECVNKKYGQIRKIKVNSGNIKQSHITEFFFTQIRNIIAHGRYTIINSGSYDTLEEYDSYNMSSFDNRYQRGLQRELRLFENNQLNVAYDKDNSFNMKYIIHLAKTLYAKGNNPFVKIIDIFDTKNKFFDITNTIEKLTEKEKEDYYALILLSKFYINFIYNYDTEEKEHYNYDELPIREKLRGTLSNKEFIYEIRTAIMHGRYTYQNNEFNFWNVDKKDNTIKSFDLKISYHEFIKLFVYKEEDFYKHMKYDPNELIVGRKLK